MLLCAMGIFTLTINFFNFIGLCCVCSSTILILVLGFCAWDGVTGLTAWKLCEWVAHWTCLDKHSSAVRNHPRCRGCSGGDRAFIFSGNGHFLVLNNLNLLCSLESRATSKQVWAFTVVLWLDDLRGKSATLSLFLRTLFLLSLFVFSTDLSLSKQILMMLQLTLLRSWSCLSNVWGSIANHWLESEVLLLKVCSLSIFPVQR